MNLAGISFASLALVIYGAVIIQGLRAARKDMLNQRHINEAEQRHQWIWGDSE